jgi:hypothetical protein
MSGFYVVIKETVNQRKAGVFLSYVLTGIKAVVGTPMLLTFFNKNEYGLYQLVGSMIAYLMLMDLGLSTTVTRYYSGYLVKNDTTGQENLLSIAFILYSVIAMLIVVVGSLFLYFLLPLYHKTLLFNDIVLVEKMFYIMLVNFALVIPANIFVVVINSHEHILLQTRN